jgi:hypothetical protein
MDSQLEPRTPEESRAYLAGYAAALDVVLNQGVQAAADTGKLLAETLPAAERP